MDAARVRGHTGIHPLQAVELLRGRGDPPDLPRQPRDGIHLSQELAEELNAEVGPFFERDRGSGEPTNAVEQTGKALADTPNAFQEWITLDEWLELCEYQGDWMARTCAHLMGRYDWDLLLNQFHCIDHRGTRWEAISASGIRPTAT